MISRYYILHSSSSSIDLGRLSGPGYQLWSHILCGHPGGSSCHRLTCVFKRMLIVQYPYVLYARTPFFFYLCLHIYVICGSTTFLLHLYRPRNLLTITVSHIQLQYISIFIRTYTRVCANARAGMYNKKQIININ